MFPELPAPTSVPPPQPPRPPGRLDGHQQLLLGVQRQQRRQLWLRGAAWGLVAALVLVLLAGLLGAVAPPVARWLLWLSPLAFLGTSAAFGLGVARQQVGSPERTARLIADRAPELGLDVLAAIELEQALQRPAENTFSPGLARAFLERTSARAASVIPARIVDRAPLRQAAMVAGGALLVGLVLLIASRERLTGGWRLALATAAEPTEQAPAAREPITGDVELVYQYPAHTGLAPRTVSGTRGDINAPAGTVVQLSTRSDRPVERAEIVLGETRIPLRVQDGRQLSGGFVVERPGTYAFVFQDGKGRELARGPDLPVVVEADSPPEVTLRFPEEQLEVDPGALVELRYEVRDDHGLTGLSLVYREPGASAEKRIKLPSEDSRSMRGTYRWDTKGLRLNPGDRVTYYVEALDNDAVAGPKKGVSRTQSLKLYDASEQRRLALEKAEALWGRLLDLLADRLESPDRDPKATPQQLLAGAATDARGLELMQTLRDTAAELAKNRDVPPELPVALSNVADSTGRKVRATSEFRRILERLAGRSSRITPDLERRLAELTTEEIATEEKDILYLEALLDRRKLEELRKLGEELLSRRRELSSQIEELKKAPDDAAREAILHEVKAMRRQIEELMRRMSELAKGIRDEHLNAEALEELMSEGDMGSMLDEVEKLMREGKLDEALAKLQEVGMQMEEMLQDFERASDTQGAEEFPELTERFLEFQKELQDTVSAQEALARETQSLKDKSNAQDKARLQQRGEQLRERVSKKLEEISRDYAQLPGERLDRHALNSLERAQEALRTARDALESKDYDLAAETAQQAAENAELLRQWGELQRERDRLFFNPPAAQAKTDELAQQLEKDARLAQEVQEELSNLFPKPGSQLSRAEKQRMEQLSREQKKLEQRAQGLSEQLEQMQQLAPVFDQESMNQMSQVAERMGQAAERLDGQDARRGHGEQQAALDGLNRFQEQLQQRGQGKGGKGIPLPLMAGGAPGGRGEGSGGGMSQEKVEIPDEDAFQSPREFRKDLLDAMKQGAPDRYREQLKRYYEELVK